jgi:non-heme chloroperoxidase
VILDYIRHFGEDRIGGLHFVDALTKLGSDDALALVAPEFLALVPGFFSTDVKESVSSLEAFLRMCLARETAPEDMFLMLGYNVSVPPYVRQGLFSRAFSNDDLLPKIRKPVLITHGAADAIVNPAIVDLHKKSIPRAEIHRMENAGHAPFWDDAAAFNQRQRDFSRSLEQKGQAGGAGTRP